MKKLIDYIKAVRLEWFKITWPTRDAVIRAVIMIFIFAGLLSLFLFVVDSVLNLLVNWVF
ncbi:MAG: preprotein translocase subunit SecE [Alphaproteobacteria bacterium]|nr:preprotein translocase subunit SecE [Alphaproteobacteria bacterium]